MNVFLCIVPPVPVRRLGSEWVPSSASSKALISEWYPQRATSKFLNIPVLAKVKRQVKTLLDIEIFVRVEAMA